MSVIIKEVTTNKELKKFVKFNIDLYKDNPYHIPGLIEEEMVTHDRKQNPAFEVCDAIYFLAYKDGKIVGRIAGIINKNSNETWNQKRARFGFVDFIDDEEVVDALFKAVSDWAKQKGMEELQGPMGYTDMDHEGMLVEGFDQLARWQLSITIRIIPNTWNAWDLSKTKTGVNSKCLFPAKAFLKSI